MSHDTMMAVGQIATVLATFFGTLGRKVRLRKLFERLEHKVDSLERSVAEEGAEARRRIKRIESHLDIETTDVRRMRVLRTENDE